MKPYEILMVGDSLEDIETANAAGTASCLIAGARHGAQLAAGCRLPAAGCCAAGCGAACRARESPAAVLRGWQLLAAAVLGLTPSLPHAPRCAAGGGNETSSGPAPPPPLGAVPTFSVDSLAHLQARLAQCNTALGWGAYGDRTLSLSSATWDEDDDEEGAALALLEGVPQLSAAGAPPAGLDFLAALFDSGAVQVRAWLAGAGAAAGGRRGRGPVALCADCMHPPAARPACTCLQLTLVHLVAAPSRPAGRQLQLPAHRRRALWRAAR